MVAIFVRCRDALAGKVLEDVGEGIMTRMTVRLPGSLHESLRHRAREEGVSL
ncbi:MAG: toxin-antitoxin system HicB family antitoxin, partial [Nitrospinota bacterium]